MIKALHWLKEAFLAPHGRCPHGRPLTRWSSISHGCQLCWQHVDEVDRQSKAKKRDDRIEEMKEAIVRANQEIKNQKKG